MAAFKTFRLASEPAISLSSIIALALFKVSNISSTPSTSLVVPFAICAKAFDAVASFSLNTLEFVSKLLVPSDNFLAPSSRASILELKVFIDDDNSSNLSKIPKSSSDKILGDATI